MPSKAVLLQILISLTAAALYGCLQGENVSVFGTLQIGSFEVAFLVALSVLMLVPYLHHWLSKSAEQDRDDFASLIDDARKLRAQHYHDTAHDKPLPTAHNNRLLREEQDLDIHLQLLRIYFFKERHSLYHDLPRLIKLMQRRNLRQAQKLWPKPKANPLLAPS